MKLSREAGWALEEIAYYLGHVSVKGTPVIQTAVRRMLGRPGTGEVEVERI